MPSKFLQRKTLWLLALWLTLALVLFISACGKKKQTQYATSNLKVGATATKHFTGLAAGTLSGKATETPPPSLRGAVALTDLTLNAGQINFEQDGESGGEVEYNGNYLLHIMTAGVINTNVDLGNAQIPAGTYNGINFQLAPTAAVDPANTTAMSFYVKGSYTLTGGATVPVVISSTTTETVEIRGANPIVINGNTTVPMMVDFRIVGLQDWLAYELEAVGATTCLPTCTSITINDTTYPGFGAKMVEALGKTTDTGVDANGDGALAESEDMD